MPEFINIDNINKIDDSVISFGNFDGFHIGHQKLVSSFIENAAKYLKQLHDSTGKIGTFGTCSGGRHGFLAGCRLNVFDAIVECWGGNIVMDKENLTTKQPVSPSDYTSNLSAPLLGIFGNDDTSPTPEKVNLHEADLKKHNKDYEFHRYDGAGHGFFYYDRILKLFLA